MALVYTPMGEIGSLCPSFNLPSVDGNNWELENWKDSKILVVMFICAHCPYVQAIEDRLIDLGKSYPVKNVQFVAICSNDWTDFPEDRPENLFQRYRDKNYTFPYLIDETQQVAQSFGAVCTPDFFVYNSKRELAYRGRLDDSWKAPTQVHRQELRQAIDHLLNDQKIPEEQIPSMGCSIKWKE